MKSTKSLLRVGAVPALLVIMGAPVLLAGGCKKNALDALKCDASLEVKFNALTDAAASLVTVTGELKTSVAAACVAIATDLNAPNVPTGAPADFTDQQVTDACNAAVAGIQAEFNAGATVELIIEGGHCEVNAQAQFSCEASCDVSGSCTPGSIELNCEPGELSVVCQGQCSASGVCEGTASVAANCQGSCEGACTGTCDGNNTNGTKCNGVCNGTCTGNCTLAANANIDCGVNVRCKGDCTGTATLPQCEGTINPPACNIDAQCEAGCQGQASLEASCTPPEISVAVTGGVTGNLQTTLEANLPEIWNAFDLKGKVALDAAANVASSFSGVVTALGSVPACALLFVGDVVGSVTATASASVSLSVSVNASASVGTTANGG